MPNSRKHPLDIGELDSDSNEQARANETSDDNNIQSHQVMAPLHIYLDNFEVITDNNVNMMFHAYGNLNQARFAMPLTVLLSQYQLTIQCNNATYLLNTAFNYAIDYHFEQRTFYYNNQPIQIVKADLLDYHFNINHQNPIMTIAPAQSSYQIQDNSSHNNNTSPAAASSTILLPQQYPRKLQPYFYADNWEIILDDEATNNIAKLSSHKRIYNNRPVTIYSNFLLNHRFTAFNKDRNQSYTIPVNNNKHIKYDKTNNSFSYDNDLITQFEKREIIHKSDKKKSQKRHALLFQQTPTPRQDTTPPLQDEIKIIMDNYEKCLTELSSQDKDEVIEKMKSNLEAIKKLYDNHLNAEQNKKTVPGFN